MDKILFTYAKLLNITRITKKENECHQQESIKKAPQNLQDFSFELSI